MSNRTPLNHINPMQIYEWIDGVVETCALYVSRANVFLPLQSLIVIGFQFLPNALRWIVNVWQCIFYLCAVQKAHLEYIRHRLVCLRRTHLSKFLSNARFQSLASELCQGSWSVGVLASLVELPRFGSAFLDMLFQNLKSTTEFTVQNILGSEDIFDLFVNTVDISPPKVWFILNSQYTVCHAMWSCE